MISPLRLRLKSNLRPNGPWGRLRARGFRHGGFSVPAVVVVLLITTLGTLTIASRNSSGRLASVFQGQSREARDVAMAGAVQIIGALNQPANRGMLVSGRPLNQWSTTPDPDLDNPCLAALPTPISTTAEARGFGNNAEQNLIAGDSSRRFILRSVRYSSGDRAHWVLSSYAPDGSLTTTSSDGVGVDFKPFSSNLFEGTEGFIELVVEGQVLNGSGEVISRATVTEEFNVVPKCCDSSFNGTFDAFGSDTDGDTTTADLRGTDGRACAAAGTPGSLITETTGFLSGEIRPGGLNMYQLQTDGSLALLEEFLCVTPLASCEGTSPPFAEAKNGNVPGIPINKLPEPPDFPDLSVNVKEISLSGNSNIYLRAYDFGGASGLQIQECEANNTNAPTALTCNSSPADYCTRISNNVADFHCRFTTIKPTGASNVFVETSLGKVAFYFNETSAAEAKFTGGSRLVHLKCDGFQGETTPCGDDADANDFPHFALYSKNEDDPKFEFTGASVSLSAFAHFVRGETKMSGGSSITGALWTDTLVGTGDSRIIIASTNCTPGDSGYCFTTSQPIVQFIPYFAGSGGGSFDWVARSRTRIGLY